MVCFLYLKILYLDIYMSKMIIIIVLVVAIVAVGLYFLLNSPSSDNANSFTAVEVVTGAADVQIKAQADADLARAKTIELYRAALINGTDLSSGPCLSNKVIPDWVADVAHNPRTDIDDDPANQCSAFRDGTAHHFVEIDPAGTIIRVE